MMSEYGISKATSASIKNISDEIIEHTTNLQAKIHFLEDSSSRSEKENELAHKDIASQAKQQLTNVEKSIKKEISNLSAATLQGFSETDLLLEDERKSRKREDFKLKVFMGIFCFISISLGILGIIL